MLAIRTLLILAFTLVAIATSFAREDNKCYSSCRARCEARYAKGVIPVQTASPTSTSAGRPVGECAVTNGAVAQTDWDSEGVTSVNEGTSLVRSRAERWYYVSVAVSIRRRGSVGGKIYLGSQQGAGLADHTDEQSER
jgi:hypothetical protein